MSRFHYTIGCTLKCFDGHWDIEDYYGAKNLVQTDDLLHIVGIDSLRNNKHVLRIMLIRNGKIHKSEIFIEATTLDDYIGKGHFMFVDANLGTVQLEEGQTVGIPTDNKNRQICFWCGAPTKKIKLFSSVIDFCRSCDK